MHHPSLATGCPVSHINELFIDYLAICFAICRDVGAVVCIVGFVGSLVVRGVRIEVIVSSGLKRR